jgi:hypothetical protein
MRALVPVSFLPPGLMIRILDGRTREMCEFLHRPREIETWVVAQIVASPVSTRTVIAVDLLLDAATMA